MQLHMSRIEPRGGDVAEGAGERADPEAAHVPKYPSLPAPAKIERLDMATQL